MYIRTVKSRGYEYVKLAHNYLDPETGASRSKVLINFGRKDQLDVEGLTRLVGSIARFLEKQALASLPLLVMLHSSFGEPNSFAVPGGWIGGGNADAFARPCRSCCLNATSALWWSG